MNNCKLTNPVLTIPCDQLASSTIAAPKFDFRASINLAEVLRIEPDGRLFWKVREVESDAELRAAMLDIKAALWGEQR